MADLVAGSLLERVCLPLKWQWRAARGLPKRQELEAKYWAAVEPVLAAHPGAFTREDALVFLEPWLRSIAFSRGPLRDAWPWMAFPAIRHLEGLIDKSSKVFEYGAGGSSTFFASRVGELVSVEHDASWFRLTEHAMARRGQSRGFRWRGILAEPRAAEDAQVLGPEDPLSYASSDESFHGLSFRAYASAIDEFPDDHFDVILIDGRARPSCFMHAMNKVRLGGYVVLDNAERESYSWIEHAAVGLGFEVREFWGPGPYNDYCWRTVFLRRVTDHYALNELDRKLEKYLDFDNGVFVEAGANNGLRQSNSLYFEMRRGWRGVLVEAVPALYEECRRNRPRAQAVWAALGSPAQVPGTAAIRFAGLMSVVKGGMGSDEEEDAHVAAGCEVQKIEAYETSAPYSTLSHILDRCGLNEVDFLSLDVEGFEAQALEGLDLDRHRPRFILVEARYREAVDKQLLGHYEVVDVLSHHDVLYRRRQAL